jgi:hypothetical protein
MKVNHFSQKLQTWLNPNCNWMIIRWTSFLCGSEIQDGSHHRKLWPVYMDGRKIWQHFDLKKWYRTNILNYTNTLEGNLYLYCSPDFSCISVLGQVNLWFIRKSLLFIFLTISCGDCHLGFLIHTKMRSI